MNSRRFRASLWFVIVTGVMSLVLSWLTVTLLQLDADGREARRQAMLHEKLRLALWRMDSWLGPQLASESMRSADDYRAFRATSNAWTSGYRKIGPDEIRMQSPLLGTESPLFLLYFEIGQSGFRSPQVPLGNERDLCEGNGIAGDVLDRAAQRLQRLQHALSADALEAKVTGAEVQVPVLGCIDTGPETSPQAQRSVQELNNRQLAAKNSFTNYSLTPVARVSQASKETVGPLVPVWIDGEPDLLIYARRVRHEGATPAQTLQGVLVDWPALQRELLGVVGDLFGDAGMWLERCEAPDTDQQPSMLASVPARLVADYRGPVVGPDLPITTILWTTWGLTLLGLAVLGFTLRTAIGYGDRRARFASAVTHELRTPLTTFRMYSEMLAEGVVEDPDARQDYLRTLQRESDRLARVVENVLAWSRLEDGRFTSRRERVAVRGLVERSAPQLGQRLGEVGMTIDVRVDDGVGETLVDTDEDAVGQVLFNLIDNAAKYARDAEDKSVTLHARLAAGNVELIVCDHGPGIASGHQVSVFVPFDRGAVRGSSNDVPGVGLGLPLARGLMRDLGGDLRLEDNPGGGACFVIELPVA